MKMQTIRGIILCALVAWSSAAFSQKSGWSIDGRNHLLGAHVQLYYPAGVMTAPGFNGGLIQPGILVNYRFLQSPKKEWDLSINYTGKSRVKDASERTFYDNTPLVDFKFRQTGINIGKRYYSQRKSKGIAPIGRYWYFGVGYHKGKLTTLPTGDSIAVQESGLTSFNIDIGLGKEFFINDKLAISISAHTRPGATTVSNTELMDEDYRERITTFMFNRNWIVVNYGVTFFLD
jgi:hypothetical protein